MKKQLINSKGRSNNKKSNKRSKSKKQPPRSFDLKLSALKNLKSNDTSNAIFTLTFTYKKICSEY
jgi:hypothetical protein